VTGGPGSDDLEGGDGNNRVVAAGDGGAVDVIQCGTSVDEAVVDAADLARRITPGLPRAASGR
jgi:hypothetical protein